MKTSLKIPAVQWVEQNLGLSCQTDSPVVARVGNPATVTAFGRNGHCLAWLRRTTAVAPGRVAVIGAGYDRARDCSFEPYEVATLFETAKVDVYDFNPDVARVLTTVGPKVLRCQPACDDLPAEYSFAPRAEFQWELPEDVTRRVRLFERNVEFDGLASASKYDLITLFNVLGHFNTALQPLILLRLMAHLAVGGRLALRDFCAHHYLEDINRTALAQLGVSLFPATDQKPYCPVYIFSRTQASSQLDGLAASLQRYMIHLKIESQEW